MENKRKSNVKTSCSPETSSLKEPEDFFVSLRLTAVYSDPLFPIYLSIIANIDLTLATQYSNMLLQGEHVQIGRWKKDIAETKVYAIESRANKLMMPLHATTYSTHISS